MLGVGQLYSDLKSTKQDLIKTVDEKIIEVDTKIENAETILDQKIKDVNQTIERAENDAIEMIETIRNIPHLKGDTGESGKDAEPVDIEKLKEEILKEIPKIDEKSIIKKVVKAIPENKASLKIIQETVASDPMAIIDTIMSLPEGKFKLKTSNIDGLEQTFNAFRSQLSRGYLHGGGISSIIAGTGISTSNDGNGHITITNTGVVVNADKVKISSADTTANYLENKILAGSNISITKENTGINEDLRIAVTGVVLSGTALLLDQTTPQTVINGTPIFNVGLKSNALLEVSLNSATISHLTGTGIALNGADNSVVRFGMSSYGTAGTSAYASRQARGTGASPSAVQSGDQLMSLEGWGYGATGYSVASQVSFRGNASENWTDVAHGTYASIWTTPNTTLVPNEKLRIAGASGTTTIYNPVDGTTAIQFNKADGTTNVLNIDTTNGRVGIGTTSPTAVLHLKAGTATANTAPLKFTSGTVLGTPEAGTMEFDTDTLSFTITTGAARKTIAFTDSNITGSAATLTTTRTIWGQNFNGSANVTGDLALGVSSLTLTGSIGATGARATKVWTTDIESTNMPTVGGTAILTSLSAPQFTTIELGHATDTTLSRLAAGWAGVEGKYVVATADPNADTLYGWDDTDGVPSNITIGTGLTYTHATHTLSASGGSTTLTFISPYPIEGLKATIPDVPSPSSNTTGYTFAFYLTGSITVNKLSIGVTTVTTAGTVKIGIYSADGQTKEIDITTATISATGVVTTAVAGVTLSAGIHYFVLVPVSTTSIGVVGWQSPNNATFSVSAEPVASGTLTVTAGTLPTTFSPTADITATANSSIYFRLDN